MASESGSVQKEFEILTTTVGLVRGVFGVLELRGSESLDLIHRLSTNDVSGLNPGGLAWTVFTDEKGRMVDLCLVLPLQGRVRIYCSVGNEATLVAWIARFIITEDITIIIGTPGFQCTCLIGPQAIPRLISRGFLPSEASGLSSNAYSIGDGELVVLSAHPFPGVICLSSGEVVKYAGESDAVSISQEGYDAYRIFRGIPSCGCEITSDFNPYEIGLRGTISFTKGCYVGQEVIARLDTYGKVRRKLVGLLVDSAQPSPTNRSRIFAPEGEVGVLTSISPGPINGYWRGLAVIRGDRVDEDLTVQVGGKTGSAARVVSLPEENRIGEI